MNPSEFNPIDPALERAMKEIRDDSVDPAVIEAAASRVWAKLVEQAPSTHIRNCSDFQALLPDYRAGKLTPARATLLKDHLHECVACRRIYEGKVVTLPVAVQPVRSANARYRWAAAAAIVAAAGLALWLDLDPTGQPTGRAVVQTVNGSLYEISATGSIRPLAAGQELSDGVEFRTAKDSTAMLQLRDGSVLELRERSGFSTSQSAEELTIRLDRGSIIVQAAKRRKGHLNVTTEDCRVAVAGTVFSVSSGVKGSRVAVIEGEVHVTQNDQEKVLRPGEQTVTSTSLEPRSVKDEISWSRNRDKLTQQLDRLTKDLQKIPLPGARYSSSLLDRLPPSTAFYVSIPNLAAYLGEAQSVVARSLAQNDDLRAMWEGRGNQIQPVMEKLRAASEYLGDEIVITASASPDGRLEAPVFLAEMKRDGFPDFLKKQAAPLAVETRSNVAIFGPHRDSVQAIATVLDAPAGGFAGTPFHKRIKEAYTDGAGFLICADLSGRGAPQGIRYLIAGQKEVNQQTELRATAGFDGPRTGMAAWLADPAPMGALDYISPEATLVTAFVVKQPAAILDELAGVVRPIVGSQQSAGADLREELASSLGGEFSLSVDGPLVPVPSWKLVTEVYDPAQMQVTIKKLIDSFNVESARHSIKPLRAGKETVDGRDYYMIASGDANPLLEAHYTFANGYLIAGPTRAGITRALQVKTAGTSIRQSAQFLAMQPRDHYVSFSALIYQNLGKTLAPIAGLLGSFVPQGRGGENALAGLSDMKPTLIAAYGEPDRITVAGNGNIVGMGLTNLIRGNLSSVMGSALPMGQLTGTRQR